MAGSSHAIAKFTAGTLLVVTVLAALAFYVFEMVDLNQATLVFGTGPYYISLMAILGGLIILLWLAIIWDYVTISSKHPAEKARFAWPRFVWDLYAFNLAALMGVGTVIGILAAFMVKFGSGAIPNLGSPLPIDVESDEFTFNTQFTIVTCYGLILFGIDLTFAYILREKFYELRPLSEIAPSSVLGSAQQPLIPKEP